MKGTLAEGVLPGLLKDLYVGRKTGQLHFATGQERRSVSFRGGNIVNATSNVREEWLGETLVRVGLLSEADLKRATGFVLRDRKRLGLVLQEMGIMDRNGLEDALALQVREILLRVFGWSEGEYAFEEDAGGVSAGDEEVTLKLSTGEMILEAVRRVQDPDVVRYALGDVDRILGLSTDPLLRFQKITLTPADGYVLSCVDGTLSAREIIQLVPAAPEETQRSLFGLLCTGVAEYLPRPPKVTAPTARVAKRPVKPVAPPPSVAPPPVAATPSPPPSEPEAAARRREVLVAFEGLSTKNHFEVLGIPRASGETQVKEAYFRLAKRFHPDTHHDPALADLRDRIEAIFIRLGEAYEVLRNPRARAAYESDLAARAPRPVVPAEPTPPPPRPNPAETAEAAVRKAEKHMAQERYWDAIQLLEPAVQAAEGNLRQHARVLLARAYLKNPKWTRRAEEVLQTVVQENPRNHEAYLVLARIYKGGGLRSRAFHTFEKVLELNPGSEEARSEVAALAPTEEPAAPGEGGGLLRKLFGKS